MSGEEMAVPGKEISGLNSCLEIL